MGIGFKIREYRFKYKMTQKDLAKKLHVTFQAVSKWENEESEPSFDTLIQTSNIANLVIGILSISFFGTMVLSNTFVFDLWFDVLQLGAVKMPGVIFELSFDGVVFLIAAKIFLFIVSIALAIAVAILVTILCAGLSIFVYPYALHKNFKYVD